MATTPHRGDTQDIHYPRPFTAWLTDMRHGESAVELSDALVELVRKVLETGKEGTLVYTLAVKKAGRSDMVIVTDKIGGKLPEPAREDSVFFVDAGGSLSRSNPNQVDLPLKEVRED